MADLRDAVSGGHYAQKQILSRDKLVAWSHARRFATALTIAREFAGKRILDFGSGDGTFLALAMMADSPPAAAVGAELLDDVIEDCRARYRAEPRMSFVQVASLDGPEHAKRYDAVFCMEVLEHVFDWEPELARMARLLTPGGTLVVSVPVETGLPVLVKQIVRTVAGWRKIGHYPGTTAYTWSELAAAVFAGSTQHVTAAGLRFRQRAVPRSQRLQLASPPRAPEPAVRCDACRRKPLLVAWSRSRHAGVVYLSPSRGTPAVKPVRVGVVCDMREEGWHSMDLVADMLLELLPSVAGGDVVATRLRPPMIRRWTRLPIVGAGGRAQLGDRLTGRLWDYPRWLRPQGAGLRRLSHRRSQLRASHTRAAGRAHYRDVQRHRCVRGRA